MDYIKTIYIICLGLILNFIIAYFSIDSILKNNDDNFDDMSICMGDSIHDALLKRNIDNFGLILGSIENLTPALFTTLSNFNFRPYVETTHMTLFFNSSIEYDSYIEDISVSTGNPPGPLYNGSFPEWVIVHTQNINIDLLDTLIENRDQFENSIDQLRVNGGVDFVIFHSGSTRRAEIYYAFPIKIETKTTGFYYVKVNFDNLIGLETSAVQFIGENSVELQIGITRRGEYTTIFSSSRIGTTFDIKLEYRVSNILQLNIWFTSPSKKYSSAWGIYIYSLFGFAITFLGAYFNKMYLLRDEISNQKTMFLASISHEIRTPMNGIIGMSEVLEETTDLSIESHEYIRVIKSCSNYLLDLINNVLDMSKIESKHLELESEEFDMTFVKDIVNDHWNICTSKRDCNIKSITVIYENISSSQILIGDKLKCGQVIHNLLSNAIKFSNGGGINIYVRWDEVVSNNIITIRCVDNGIGVSKEDLSNIFKPFKQAHNDNKQGTGLGLTISRAFSVAMGGNLTCKSELGKGSEFIFTFTSFSEYIVSEKEVVTYSSEMEIPVVKNENISIKKRNNDKDFKVLVVDDNYINRLVLSKIISNMDLECETCESGRSAIEKCNSSRYNMIFMDKFMDDIGGIEATREIRQHGMNTDSPIVFVTADASDQSKRECYYSGGTDFVAKPISSSHIRRIIFDINNTRDK